MSKISLNNPSINSTPVSNFSKMGQKIRASFSLAVKTAKAEIISFIVQSILFVVPTSFFRFLPAAKQPLKAKVVHTQNIRQIQAKLDALVAQEIPTSKNIQSTLSLVTEARRIDTERLKRNLANLK